MSAAGEAARDADGSGGAWNEIWEIVRQIPPGTVMSFGAIASLLERRLSPVAVGWALHACPADVPWHRVVNARGECSTDRSASGTPGRQRQRLEAEGVEFDSDGRVDMERFCWRPED